ncbi:hypothetical protein [Bacillus cereus group sp. BY6-1LC]|uniref:hypothetical protein n=1 Tax=Bacillus cereus group sp. BY6-1LC TaxID=3018077 RepID=UPI0022E5CFA9|nr:hypothetical protein [Bacillus cereus group sp. BY6-1LC]MDA1802866.1 hypothetical protein [Bacillus cereus group sp. BY6-1LC]
MTNKHIKTKERALDAKEFIEFLFGKQEENEKLNIYVRAIDEGTRQTQLAVIPYKEMDFRSITNLFAYSIQRDPKTNELKRKKIGRGFHKLFLATLNHPSQEEKKGIFINFNPGGTKQEEINEIKNVGIDFDFGKESSLFDTKEEALQYAKKMYETSEFVEEKTEIEQTKNELYQITLHRKQEVIDQMKQDLLKDCDHILKYTWNNGTRNGVHALLSIKNQPITSNEEYEAFCTSLAKQFGKWKKYIDYKVFEKARVLRIPGFYHLKEQGYMVTILQKPILAESHSFEEWAIIFKFKIERNKEQIVSREKSRKDRRSIISQKASTPLKLKKKVDHPSCSMTRDEFIQHACKLHIADFFENDELYERNFCCHFHVDKRPSANIGYNYQTEKYYYHCHSKCTRHARNIFQIVKEVCNFKKFEDAVKKLASICNVKIVRTEFEIDQKFKYVSNQSFLFNLRNNANAGEISKSLEKILCTKTRLRVLEVMLQKAMSVVIKEEYSYQDEAIFFASLNHLADHLKLDRKIKAAVHQEIKMLLLLGLLGRVPFEKVPEELQKTSLRIKEENEEHARKNGDEREENVINYYFMQDFNDSIEIAEERAMMMKEKSFKIKQHLNKNALISLFGNEIADEVFPDGRKIPKWAIEISDKMKKKMAKVINEKQYVKESDLLNYKTYKIKGQVPGKKETVRKQATSKQVNTVYKNIVLTDSEIGFERIRINDQVRKQYNISKQEKGYVWI